MIAWKLAVRELRQRPGRTLLTLASVALGVGSLVAVQFGEQSTRHAFDGMYEAIAGKTDLEATASAGVSLEESVYPAVAKVAGVEAASPRLQRMTVAYHGDRRIRMLALGIVPKLDEPVQDFRLVQGSWFAKPTDVVMNADFCESAGIKLGDDVALLTRSGRQKAKVAGLVANESAVAGRHAGIILLPLRTAQSWFRAGRRIDAIEMVLADGADLAEVESAVRALVPPETNVQPPAMRSTMAEETSLAIEQALDMGSYSSLLVAAFVIANTFLISVTQRRRQLGMLRAVGATQRQVVAIILLQAAVVGAVGAALGCLVGAGAAMALTNSMGTLYDTRMPPVHFTPLPFLQAAGIGFALAMLGSAWPARKAAGLAPQEAMRSILPREIEGFSRGFAWTGLGMVVVFGSVLLASVSGRIGSDHAVWSSVLMLAGMVLLLPRVIRPLIGLVEKLFPPAMRLEGKLAARQLLVHRSRTALTVGVVFIAIATGLALANSVIDNEANVRKWYRKSIVADFFIRADSPDMSSGLSADLPDEVDEQVRAIPNVAKINTIRVVSARAKGQSLVVLASQYDDPQMHQFDVVESLPGELVDHLRQGETAVGTVLAHRLGLKPGDELPVELKEGSRPVKIAATVNDYYAGGLTAYMQLDAAHKLWGVGGVDIYTVNAAEQHRAEVQQALRELAEKNGLLLEKSADIQGKVDRMIAGVDAGLWGLVVLGFVVAAFGVTNTLTMSVLEQTREFGVLRSVAATRNQIRKMVFGESLLIGFLGVLPGVIAGQGVAYLIHLATQPVTGRVVAFVIHPFWIVAALAGGFATVLIAAWGPAERAVRLDLPQALRVE